MKKILLLCPTSSSAKNFRMALIKKLQKDGYEVGVSAFDEIHKDVVEATGAKFFCVRTSHRSLNPFHIVKQRKFYKEIIKEFQPDIVFTFVLKPNTIGVLSASKMGMTNIYSMVEGAGDAFGRSGLKWKLLRILICSLYKRSFKKVKKVFFLNNDDKNEFINRKLLRADQAELIHGIGVDLDRFAFKQLKNNNQFLMIARMIKKKGAIEYCKCARIVKKKFPNAIFNYLGAEGDVKLSDIKEFIDDGSINYLGTTTDVRPYLEETTAFVLPSKYREGLPMSIMEAESVGRCIITTDNVGCRDTVIDGYNGFIVSKGDIDELAEKCIFLLENHDKAIEMGLNARAFAEKNFDSYIINEYILSIILQK